MSDNIKIIAKNKRASYDYFLMEKFEAGVVLRGTEVKVLRQGKVNLQEAYVTIDDHEEAWIHNINIPHYDFGNINNHLETRPRKLLLNKKEIKNIAYRMKTERLSLIPTIIYFSKSRVKLEVALGKGKKHYDKRKVAAEKDAQKKVRQSMGKFSDL